MATTPVLPTCSVTSYPALRKRPASSGSGLCLVPGEFGILMQIKIESVCVRIDALDFFGGWCLCVGERGE